ncbi:MAG TPA: Asp23/Gls24 family envelope stress response protein [Clostridiales bacterium]|nr:Asp23/Gls24 family envelope stress response protein [Clostridiales bacterium]
MEEINTNIQGEIGSVKITDEVVSVIAGLAAIEVQGVASMSGGFAGGIAEALGMKNLSKGVKVEVTEKEAIINLFIIVEYGARIPEVAWNIQENVKKTVESMTGLVVTEVNIHVQGINIIKENKKEMSIKPDGEQIEQDDL